MMARSKPPNCCPIVLKWVPYPPSPLQKIKFSLGRQEGETGPLGLVLLQEAAGKVLRRQNMHLEIHRDFDFREPIFFVEPHCIKAPLFKVRADAKGVDDLPDLWPKRHEARIIQMISVIVGQQENVDGREIFGGADIAARKLL